MRFSLILRLVRRSRKSLILFLLAKLVDERRKSVLCEADEQVARFKMTDGVVSFGCDAISHQELSSGQLETGEHLRDLGDIDAPQVEHFHHFLHLRVVHRLHVEQVLLETIHQRNRILIRVVHRILFGKPR